jgi:hypothetical protein
MQMSLVCILDGAGTARLVWYFKRPMLKFVLHCDPNIPSSVEVYYQVDDVLAAVADYAAQGWKVLVAPFDITIGKCAVIRDPFGTSFASSI